jgi:4-carboxymuconolactone decarboxylase
VYCGRASPFDDRGTVSTRPLADTDKPALDTMSRLELLDLDDIPEEYHHLFTDDYLGDRHIFRAWAHNPEVLEATLEYLNVLYEQLGQRRKELVILTVARARGARYEWHQHVDIARDKGVSIAEMQAIGGDDFSMFDDAEFVLLQYARGVESGTVTDQIHDALARVYTPGEIVAIGLLIDFYVGLCNYIASVDLPFEGGEFVGWVPEEETVSELFG